MKQIQHILTELLYIQLHDPAWKMTSTRIENNCRVVVIIESKRSDLSPKIKTIIKESFSDKLVIKNLTGETRYEKKSC